MNGEPPTTCLCCGTPTPAGRCGRCWNGDCIGGKDEDQHIVEAAVRRSLDGLGWPP